MCVGCAEGFFFARRLPEAVALIMCVGCAEGFLLGGYALIMCVGCAEGFFFC
jgi:hypothetical protein